MLFKLQSEYQPQGDQPQAIDALVRSIEDGNRFQTLLEVTGSGKTFTMANVIQQLQRPALVISHNKTLAAQLFSEFKGFFLRTQSNTSLAITTIISLKPTYRRLILTLRRTLPSMMRLSAIGSLHPVP